MKRFAIGIQYLGTPYAGFSRTYGRSKLTALSLTEQLALNKGIGFERGDDLPSLKGYIETSKPTLGVLDVVEDALGKMCGERGRFDNLKSSSRQVSDIVNNNSYIQYFVHNEDQLFILLTEPTLVCMVFEMLFM